MHSRVQKQVLALYKSLLRAGYEKPGVKAAIQSEFRKNASIPRTDTMLIEHLMRNGNRKLDMIKDPHVSQIGAFKK